MKLLSSPVVPVLMCSIVLHSAMVALVMGDCPKVKPDKCKCSLPAGYGSDFTICSNADDTNRATCVALHFGTAKDGNFTTQTNGSELTNVQVAPDKDKVDCYDDYTCVWYMDTMNCGTNLMSNGTVKSNPQKLIDCP